MKIAWIICCGRSYQWHDLNPVKHLWEILVSLPPSSKHQQWGNIFFRRIDLEICAKLHHSSSSSLCWKNTLLRTRMFIFPLVFSLSLAVSCSWVCHTVTLLFSSLCKGFDLLPFHPTLHCLSTGETTTLHIPATLCRNVWGEVRNVVGNAACCSSSLSYAGLHEVIFSAERGYAHVLISICDCVHLLHVLLRVCVFVWSFKCVTRRGDWDKIGFNALYLVDLFDGNMTHCLTKTKWEYLFNQLRFLEHFPIDCARAIMDHKW